MYEENSLTIICNTRGGGQWFGDCVHSVIDSFQAVGRPNNWKISFLVCFNKSVNCGIDTELNCLNSLFGCGIDVIGFCLIDYSDLGLARYEAFQVVDSEWLSFLDDDDLLKPSFFTEFFKFVSEADGCKSRFLCASYQKIDNHGGMIRDGVVKPNPTERWFPVSVHTMVNYCVGFPTFVASRQSIAAVIFPKNFSYIVDKALIIRLMLAGNRPIVAASVTALYRLNVNGISFSRPDLLAKELRMLLPELMGELNGFDGLVASGFVAFKELRYGIDKIQVLRDHSFAICCFLGFRIFEWIRIRVGR